MPLSAELIARLGLNTTLFERGLARASAEANKAGDRIGKSLANQGRVTI